MVSEQYLDTDVGKDWYKEVFVDMGCWDGATSIRFAKHVGKNLKKVIAFEPDITRIDICGQNMAGEGLNFELVNKGAWSKEEVVMFTIEDDNKEMLRQSAEGKLSIYMTSLDILTDERVTFIKMDIEGAEIEAIKGCKQHIQRDKPILAICVYHKPEDIIAIPQLLIEYNNQYRFKLRHYTPRATETVLYAF